MADLQREAYFSGEGATLSLGGGVGGGDLQREVFFGGEGTTSSGEGGGTGQAEASFSGGGRVLRVQVRQVIPPEMTLQILDKYVYQAPTPITVAVVDGQPEALLRFRLDGLLLYTARADSDGCLYPTSITIPEELGSAGQHEVEVTQTGSISASDTFRIKKDPSPSEILMGPDAQAVEVPDAIRPNGTRAWVFQDLIEGGLGSWVMPQNPIDGPPPYFERKLLVKTSTAGRQHISEGSNPVLEWTFSGIAPDEEFADKLTAYGELNRRLYIINDRNQAFKVLISHVELVPRLQKVFGDQGKYRDAKWIDGHDYTVTALVLDQEWVTPA